METRQLRHALGFIKRINKSLFLGGFIFFALLSVYELRQNNLQMVRLSQALVQADKDDKDVEAALGNLRSFIYGHMNTNPASSSNAIKPPIQLKYTYERLVKATKVSVSASLQADAYKSCQKQFLPGDQRSNCVASYVDAIGIQSKSVPDSLYKFDFVSPTWSPDLAGISLVFSGLFALLFATRVATERWLRHRLG